MDKTIPWGRQLTDLEFCNGRTETLAAVVRSIAQWKTRGQQDSDNKAFMDEAFVQRASYSQNLLAASHPYEDVTLLAINGSVEPHLWPSSWPTLDPPQLT